MNLSGANLSGVDLAAMLRRTHDTREDAPGSAAGPVPPQPPQTAAAPGAGPPIARLTLPQQDRQA